MTDAIMAALDDPGTKGQIFEAMGPHRYLQAHLIEWMFETMHAHALYSWDRREQMICPTLWAKAAFWSLGEKLRIPGIKHSCAPTLERLERVSVVFLNHCLGSVMMTCIIFSPN